MFKTRKKLNQQILDLQIENANLRIENDNLKLSIKRHEEMAKELRSEIEDEHLENYHHHKKLLAIERLLNNSFGSCKDLLEFRNKVQKIIKNELVDSKSH